MTNDVKRAAHLAEQAEKHAKMLATNPGEQQFHLDSIMELLEGMARAIGSSPEECMALARAANSKQTSAPPPSLEPDPESAWRQELER